MLDTVVIMTTGHGSEQIAAAALQERAEFSSSIKPLVAWQLADLVQSSLDKQEARRRLSALTQIYLGALDNLPVRVFIVDNAYHIRGWNRAMALLTGFDAKRVMDQELSASCPFCAQLASQDWENLVTEGGQRVFDEMLAVTPDGKRVVLSASLTYLESAQVTIGVVEDITRRIEMRDRLLNAERMEALSKMVVTASHEINGPLTVILGNALFAE